MRGSTLSVCAVAGAGRQTLHEEQLLEGRVQQLQVAMETLNIQWQLVTQQLASLGPAFGGAGGTVAQAGTGAFPTLYGARAGVQAPCVDPGAAPPPAGVGFPTPPHPPANAAPGPGSPALGLDPAVGPRRPLAR